MKTLYNSLKPEYRDKLEEHAKEYPATIMSIKKSLYYNEARYYSSSKSKKYKIKKKKF